MSLFIKEIQMSTVISLLEKIGKDANLRYADKTTMTEQLSAVLAARTNVVCGIYAAEEAEEQEEITSMSKAG
jgi:hypothetical protein